MSQNSPIQSMTIFVRQFTGGSVALQVPVDCSMADFAELAFEEHKNTAFSRINYYRAIGWYFAGKSFTDVDRKLVDYGVREHSTINEIPRGFTMSPNFNWKKLCVEDCLSLDDTMNIIFLNPGCTHSFDIQELKKWIETCKSEERDADCPLCRTLIEQTHLDRLQK